MEKQERLFDIPYYQLENFPQEVMFSSKIDDNWVPTSTKEFIDKANKASRGLIALGINEGDKVALVSANRVEWNIMDIAIQQVGAIGVPIYPNISIKDYKFIFTDAEIKLCITGSQELYEKITSIKDQIPTLEKIYCFDKFEGAEHWEKISDAADPIDISEVEKRKEKIKHEDLATMIYTSGTTGNPKGVMLSHRNILSNVYSSYTRVPIVPNYEGKCLTFLPVCHVYERMLHYLYIYAGFSIYFAESLETIGDNLKETQPHVFSAVPRLLEKVYEKIISKGDDLTGIKKLLFFWAVKLGNEYELEGKSGWYKFKLAIARKLIFSKWQEALGGNVIAVVSGAAALQPRLARIFFAAGIPVLEGYGLTETSPVIAVNKLKDWENGVRFGTVGPILDGVEVKFSEEGEILVKGPNVMMGYYKLPEKTKEVYTDDGWFKTGDIGEMVDGKFLKITDRMKEIFKTSGGKYIIPQAMENKFKESRFIEQIMVVGEGYKHPAALIVPSFDFVREWGERKGIEIPKDNAELIEVPEVIERIGREVDYYNKNFGNYEMVKKFELLPEEFSIEKGEITPTLKFKRKNILKLHEDKIRKIYGSLKDE
ncbi:MAG: long-chain fatty acid--CoA ligase [Brumimicrobium sp.]